MGEAMIIPDGRNCYGWSGMTSARKPSYQKGVREIVEEISGFFISSQSGYDGWKDVKKSILKQGITHVFIAVHSNGGKAATWLARDLKPHGVQVTILMFDCTAGSVADLGSNVPDVMDIYAGGMMQRLTEGPDFQGNMTRIDVLELSHIGMQQDEEVIERGRVFAREWRSRNPTLKKNS